jgi:calcium-dependent protein kinase
METFNVSAHDFINERTSQLRDDYEVKEMLGEGAYGSVRKVTHRLIKEDRAVKILSKKHLKTENDLRAIANEVSILRSLDHPNILKVYETYQDKFSYFIVTELCTGGEIFDKIISHGTLSEELAANYMRQILSCLVYCHDRNIVHRDLKPENFLLDSDSPSANIKLIDFGAAATLNEGEFLTNKIGTSYYIAPEVISMRYNEKCDIWSVGANLYLMLSGKPAFNGKTDAEILHNVSTGKYVLTGSE